MSAGLRVYAQRCSESPKSFCTGKRRPLQNDGLDIGSCQTRPARHGSKRKITVRWSGSRLCEARMSVWLMLAAACTQQVGGLRPRPRPAERPRPSPPNATGLVLDDPHSIQRFCAREGRASHGERAGRWGVRMDKGCSISNLVEMQQKAGGDGGGGFGSYGI